MITSEQEYQIAKDRLASVQDFASKQRAALVELGLAPDEVDRAMQPVQSFQAGMEEELVAYKPPA